MVDEAQDSSGIIAQNKPLAVEKAGTAEYRPHVYQALEQVLLDVESNKVAKLGGEGLFDMVKGMSVHLLRENRQKDEELATVREKLRAAETQRDIVTERLAGQLDVNILHTVLLAAATALLSSYASYDSSGKGAEVRALLVVGIVLGIVWLGIVIRRVIAQRNRPSTGV